MAEESWLSMGESHSYTATQSFSHSGSSRTPNSADLSDKGCLSLAWALIAPHCYGVWHPNNVQPREGRGRILFSLLYISLVKVNISLISEWLGEPGRPLVYLLAVQVTISVLSLTRHLKSTNIIKHSQEFKQTQTARARDNCSPL